MRKKRITVVMTLCIIVSLLSGCTTKESEGIILEEDTEVTEEVVEEETDGELGIKIGDSVEFGKYEQDNDVTNGSENILWTVMDVKDGKAFLVSDYILDNIEYNESQGIYGDEDLESLPWSQSYIYSWLNEEFFNIAFTEEEQSIIVDTTDYSSEEDIEIIGKCFLLSYEELEKYFGMESMIYLDSKGDEEEYSYSENLLCEATLYAVEERDIDTEEFTEKVFDNMEEKGFVYDSKVIGNEYSAYWLRSSLSWDSWFTAEGHAMVVDEQGSIELGVASLSNMKTKENGIRPCIWIDIEKVSDYFKNSEETDGDMSVTEEEFSESEKSESDIEATTEINVYEILELINDYPLYFLVDTLSDGQTNEMGTIYDVQDNGDGYTVTGTIKALDVIMKDTGIEEMEEGDEVTSALGIKYIVTYNDHASSGNSIKIEMNDMEGNTYYILSSLSGTGLTSSFVNVLEIDSGLAVIKTYEHVSFEVPIGSALIYPSGLLLDIGGEDVTDYQGIWMPDGVIHSNSLPEDIDNAVYDENGNVIAD